MINSDRERELNLGRDWKLPPLKKNQVYLKSSLANLLDVGVGDIVYFDIDASKLGSFWKSTLENSVVDGNLISRTLHVILPLTVAQVYFDPAGTSLHFQLNSLGKYGIDKSAAIVELSSFYSNILENMSPELDPFTTLRYPPTPLTPPPQFHQLHRLFSTNHYQLTSSSSRHLFKYRL